METETKKIYSRHWKLTEKDSFIKRDEGDKGDNRLSNMRAMPAPKKPFSDHRTSYPRQEHNGRLRVCSQTKRYLKDVFAHMFPSGEKEK